MSDQTMIPIKQLMKEFSDDFGIEFIEDLMALRSHFQQNLQENFAKVGVEEGEKLSGEIAKGTFEFTVRAIKPMWEKLQSLEREIKFLRQK